MAIKLKLHHGLPETLDRDLFFPVSPDDIDSHSRGWTTYELARIVFNTISVEWPEDGRKIGHYLEALDEEGELDAYGPSEGDYLVRIPGDIGE